MELIHLIEDVFTRQANLQINTGTGMPPHTLFEKEKEYLKPLPSKILLDSSSEGTLQEGRAADPTFVLQGNRYSLGSEYVSKTVDIYPIGDELYIYFQRKLSSLSILYHMTGSIMILPTIWRAFVLLREKAPTRSKRWLWENLSRLKVLGKEGKEDDDD